MGYNSIFKITAFNFNEAVYMRIIPVKNLRIIGVEFEELLIFNSFFFFTPAFSLYPGLCGVSILRGTYSTPTLLYLTLPKISMLSYCEYTIKPASTDNTHDTKLILCLISTPA